jgi:hypothetical protein
MITRFLTCILVVAAQGIVHADTASSNVRSMDGSATVTTHGKSMDVSRDSMIAPGSTIHTGASGHVALHLMPGADTVVGPNTDMTIEKLDYSKDASGDASRTVVLKVEKGEVFNNIAHGDGEGTSDFRVRTPRGVAAARGTQFKVTVSGQQCTVEVTQDTVVFHGDDGKNTTLHSGREGTFPGGIIIVLTPREIAEIEKIISQFLGGYNGNPGGGGGGGANGGNGGNGGGNLNPGNNGNGSGSGQNSPD